jgi:hypothetical protein
MKQFWTTRQLAKKFDSNIQEMRSFLRTYYSNYLRDGRYELPSSELSAAHDCYQRWKNDYSPTQRKVVRLQKQLEERIAGRTNTAKQIAAMFGTTPEKLRILLREMYPNHQGQWRFTLAEVEEIRAKLAQRDKSRALPAGPKPEEPERLHVATKMTNEDRIRAELAGEVEIDDPYIRAWEGMSRLLGSQLNTPPPQVKGRVIGQ